jgi:hypothetical protein
MSVGMFVSPPIRAGVWHLGIKVAMVAWYAAPTGGSSRAEEMWGLAMSGDVIKPGAVGATTAFLILVLCQSIVLGVFAVPGNGTVRPSSQA